MHDVTHPKLCDMHQILNMLGMQTSGIHGSACGCDGDRQTPALTAWHGIRMGYTVRGTSALREG